MNEMEIISSIFGQDVGNIMEATNLFVQIRSRGEIPCNLPLSGIALALLFPPPDENGKWSGSDFETDVLGRFAKEICGKTDEIAEHMRRMRQPEFIEVGGLGISDNKGNLISQEEYFHWVDSRISQLSIWAKGLASLAKRPDAHSWIGTILSPRPRPSNRRELVSRFMMGTSFYDTIYLQELKQSAKRLLAESTRANEVFHVPGGNWIYSIGHAAEDVFFIISYIANDIEKNLSLRAIKENANDTLPMATLNFWLVDNMQSETLLEEINRRMEEIHRRMTNEKSRH